MKTIFALSLVLLSFNLSAFEQKASLDFTNLYGQTNAGAYEMKVSFEAKKTLSETTLSFSTHRDDNDLYCVTTASFHVGVLNFTLTDVKTGWTKNITKKISGSISSQSNDETCETNIEAFAGNQNLYVSLGLNEAITLPVVAPFDYKTVGVYLAPFNGYLTLQSSVNVKGNKLVLDPSELFSAGSIQATNTQNASVTYYVFAQKEATTLSLGTGLIKF